MHGTWHDMLWHDVIMSWHDVMARCLRWRDVHGLYRSKCLSTGPRAGGGGGWVGVVLCKRHHTSKLARVSSHVFDVFFASENSCFLVMGVFLVVKKYSIKVKPAGRRASARRIFPFVCSGGVLCCVSCPAVPKTVPIWVYS